MYSGLLNRLKSINYKTITMQKGEATESEDVLTFNGYISYSLEHLINAGVDVSGIKASIVTDKLNRDKLKEGDLVSIGDEFYSINKILSYMSPFSFELSTFEILI